MLFNKHSNLVGTHAFLSASNFHWIRYDDEKLDRMFLSSMAAKRGRDLHELAYQLIRLGVKLPQARKTLNLYVNDAIGYQMTPELVLYYSANCYGTADTIGFRNNKLRIHDLKTGITETSVEQLEVYAALFCLEYRHSPTQIKMEFRIYQSDEVKIYDGDADKIIHIIDRIITFDKRITAMRMEAFQ